MADERKVYDKVSWLCRGVVVIIEGPWKGVYIPIDDESGRFYFGEEPLTEESTRNRGSVMAKAAHIYERESDAWVEYGKMHAARAIESVRESERAMLKAIDARSTEELRRMTGTETKGA